MSTSTGGKTHQPALLAFVNGPHQRTPPRLAVPWSVFSAGTIGQLDGWSRHTLRVRVACASTAASDSGPWPTTSVPSEKSMNASPPQEKTRPFGRVFKLEVGGWTKLAEDAERRDGRAQRDVRLGALLLCSSELAEVAVVLDLGLLVLDSDLLLLHQFPPSRQ